MHASGEYTIAELMEVFSVGRATVYRVLHRAKQKTIQAQEDT
jgi:transposase